MEMLEQGLLGAITLLGKTNEGFTDQETHAYLKKVAEAMETKNRSLWPDKELRTHVNALDKTQYDLFLNVVRDMIEGLDDHYGLYDGVLEDE